MNGSLEDKEANACKIGESMEMCMVKRHANAYVW